MRSILITGGCGFIGSHTCLVLLERGYDIWIVDSCINSSPKSLERAQDLITSSSNLYFHKGDIRDKVFLNEVFKQAKNKNKPISGVIHFAGLKSVEESMFNPFDYWDVNVNGTLNLLSVMKENDCKTIVFSSSATIYGTNGNLPIKESSVLKSINPYGTTKIVVEKLLDDIFKSFSNEWRISSLRYFNPIGAHSSGHIGEDPRGKPQNIFPLIIQVAIGKIEKLQIYGNDWPTHDGTGIRDYIHIMDLANAHVHTLDLLFKEKPQILNLNIGTGKGTSVLELIKTFEEVNNIKIPYEFTHRRKGDCSSIIADNSLATSCLKWSPNRDLKKMCKDGWKWQISNPCGYI